MCVLCISAELHVKADGLLLCVLSEDEAGKDIGDVWALRKAQLELRQAEVLEALHLLDRLNAGQGSELEAESTCPAPSKTLGLAEWQNRLDLKSPWALGHSFGGATAIELLRKTDSPFARGLVLDPVSGCSL